MRSISPILLFLFPLTHSRAYFWSSLILATFLCLCTQLFLTFSHSKLQIIASSLDYTYGRCHCLAPSTCVPIKTCFSLGVPLLMPYPQQPFCQVKYQHLLMWKMLRPEAISSRRKGRKKSMCGFSCLDLGREKWM